MLTLKTLLPQGLTKFTIFFLKTEFKGELRVSVIILFHLPNADGKKELRRSYFLLQTEESTDFDDFLFRMSCCVEGLRQMNILGSALQQLCKNRKVDDNA